MDLSNEDRAEVLNTVLEYVRMGVRKKSTALPYLIAKSGTPAGAASELIFREIRNQLRRKSS